jgi:hypothetical protein
LNSGKNSTIENNTQELKKEHKIEMIKQSKKIDSLNKTTKNLSIENSKLTREIKTKSEKKIKK